MDTKRLIAFLSLLSAVMLASCTHGDADTEETEVADVSTVLTTSVVDTDMSERVYVQAADAEKAEDAEMSADEKKLEDMGILHLTEEYVVWEKFTSGLLSKDAVTEKLVTSDGLYIPLVIARTNLSAEDKLFLEDIFGELTLNEDGYYDCPFKSEDDLGKYESRLFSVDHIASLSDSERDFIVRNDMVYTKFGNGAALVSPDFSTAKIISESENEIRVKFYLDEVPDHYVCFDYVKENGDLKIGGISYDTTDTLQSFCFDKSTSDNEYSSYTGLDDETKQLLKQAEKLYYTYFLRVNETTFDSGGTVQFTVYDADSGLFYDNIYTLTGISYDSFRDTLLEVFTDNFTESLLSRNIYRNFNGELCYYPYAEYVGNSCFDSIEFKPAKQTEDETDIIGNAHYTDNEDTFSEWNYTYEYKLISAENGRRIDLFEEWG